MTKKIGSPDNRNEPKILPFFKNDVLFLGVNVAGKYAREDDSLWQDLDDDNIVWTRERLKEHESDMKALVIFGHARPGPRQYDYYFRYLQHYLQKLNIPVLYMHGDSLDDQPLLHVYEPYKSEGFNIKALEVQRGGIAEPVQVVVSGTHGFVIDRNEKHLDE